MSIMEYRTDPTNGTVHVAPTLAARRTFCGIIADDWPLGDETHNGVASTCARCSAAIRARKDAETNADYRAEAEREQAWERRNS